MRQVDGNSYAGVHCCYFVKLFLVSKYHNRFRDSRNHLLPHSNLWYTGWPGRRLWGETLETIFCCLYDKLVSLNRMIKASELTFNFNKTYFLKFYTNNKTCVNLNIGFDDKTIQEVETTEFCGLQIDSNLNWKTHVQYISPKLSSAGVRTRKVTSLMKVDFKISLLFLFPFHHVIWNSILGKCSAQQKSILHRKENRQNNDRY